MRFLHQLNLLFQTAFQPVRQQMTILQHQPVSTLRRSIHELSGFLFHSLTQGQIFKFGSSESHRFSQFGNIRKRVTTGRQNKHYWTFFVGLRVDLLVVESGRLHKMIRIISFHYEFLHSVDNTVRT